MSTFKFNLTTSLLALMVVIIISIAIAAGVNYVENKIENKRPHTSPITKAKTSYEKYIQEIYDLDFEQNISASEYNMLLIKLFDLYNIYNTNDIIGQATIVSEIDSIVLAFQDLEIKSGWDKITACIGSACNKERLFDYTIDLTRTVTLKALASKELDEGTKLRDSLLVIFIDAYQYWRTNKVVEFSRAIAETNKLVKQIGKPELIQSWTEVVECDKICEKKHKLVISFLRTALE